MGNRVSEVKPLPAQRGEVGAQRRVRGAVLLAAVLLSTGCTFAVLDLDFRTYEPETAFDRAVQAVEANCHGVKSADREGQIVFSAWQAWHTSEGVYLSRCMISLVPRPEDKTAAVRVAFAMRQCPLVDVSDVEAIVEQCAVTRTVPDIVATQLNNAARVIERDVGR